MMRSKLPHVLLLQFQSRKGIDTDVEKAGVGYIYLMTVQNAAETPAPGRWVPAKGQDGEGGDE